MTYMQIIDMLIAEGATRADLKRTIRELILFSSESEVHVPLGRESPRQAAEVPQAEALRKWSETVERIIDMLIAEGATRADLQRIIEELICYSVESERNSPV